MSNTTETEVVEEAVVLEEPASAAEVEEVFGPRELKESLFGRFIWTVVFTFLFWFVRYLIFMIGFAQLVVVIFNKNRPSEHLAKWGSKLGTWMFEATNYVSATTEAKPWPFSRM